MPCCTLAMAEAYGMTNSSLLRRAGEEAMAFIAPKTSTHSVRVYSPGATQHNRLRQPAARWTPDQPLDTLVAHPKSRSWEIRPGEAAAGFRHTTGTQARDPLQENSAS